jgi:glycosyltransferase involved in cell wall biosynthesis
MREIRLLVLTPKPKGVSPSQRFRLEQWAPHLAARHGIRLDFAPFESPALTKLLALRSHVPVKAYWVLRDFVRRSAILFRARRYDAVVIHREAALIGPAIYERWLAGMNIPIIFDFDDAIWSPQQARSQGQFSRLRFPAKTATICRLATAVTAGNDFLADFARKNGATAYVVPTSIELADYPTIAEPAADRPFVVCWTGSTTTLVHFEIARAALEAFAQRVPLRVKLICNEPPARPLAGAEIEFVRWSPRAEAETLGSCHVGIMPLPDDEIARGKCGLKALQCMATGRPVVVSPVGVNSKIVTSQVNGFLASSVDEWIETLSKLAASSELRARLGANARRTVEDNYSSEISAAHFARVVHSVVHDSAVDS